MKKTSFPSPPSSSLSSTPSNLPLPLLLATGAIVDPVGDPPDKFAHSGADHALRVGIPVEQPARVLRPEKSKEACGLLYFRTVGAIMYPQDKT